MSDGSKHKALAVITVAYNSANVLPGFLDSLPEGLAGIGHYEIIVADNASSDHSAELARMHPLRPRVIRTGWNGGYSAGINAALKTVATGTDILILNPDIRLLPGAARLLVNRLAQQSVGIAAPQILSEEHERVHSLRREPSVLGAWSDALLGGRLGGRLGLGEVLTDPQAYDASSIVDWASGAALAVKAEAFDRVGLWDESFFLYSEETEYCRRAREAGYTVAYEPAAKAVHIGGEYRTNSKLYGLTTTNRIRYYRRYHGALAAMAFQFAVVVGEAVRSACGTRPVSGLKAALSPQSGFMKQAPEHRPSVHKPFAS